MERFSVSEPVHRNGGEEGNTSCRGPWGWAARSQGDGHTHSLSGDENSPCEFPSRLYLERVMFLASGLLAFPFEERWSSHSCFPLSRGAARLVLTPCMPRSLWGGRHCVLGFLAGSGAASCLLPYRIRGFLQWIPRAESLSLICQPPRLVACAGLVVSSPRWALGSRRLCVLSASGLSFPTTPARVETVYRSSLSSQVLGTSIWCGSGMRNMPRTELASQLLLMQPSGVRRGFGFQKREGSDLCG